MKQNLVSRGYYSSSNHIFVQLVGKRYAYYAKTFVLLYDRLNGSSRKVISDYIVLNWGAFLFSLIGPIPVFYLYRRMYKISVAFCFAWLASRVFIDLKILPAVSYIYSLLYSVGSLLFSNYIYFKYINKKIALSLVSDFVGSDFKKKSTSGGISILLPILITILLFLLAPLLDIVVVAVQVLLKHYS